MRTHRKYNHGGVRTISCSFEGCEKSFFKRLEMGRHYKTHYTEVIGTCETCTKTFKRQSSLENHLANVHPPYKKSSMPFACHICEYRAVHQNSLNVHIRSKHMGISFDCDRCQYKGTEKGALKRHIQTRHEGVRYCCPLCTFKTSTKNQVKRHIKKKHKDQCHLYTQHDPVKE